MNIHKKILASKANQANEVLINSTCMIERLALFLSKCVVSYPMRLEAGPKGVRKSKYTKYFESLSSLVRAMKKRRGKNKTIYPTYWATLGSLKNVDKLMLKPM
jgi:hypothetical protein